MLKQRIVTAIALLLGVGIPVLLMPPSGFAVLALAVFMLAAWEWTRLCSLDEGPAQVIYIAGTGVLLALLYFGLGFHSTLLLGGLKTLFIVAGVWWAIALLWIQTYPGSTALWGTVAVRALIGWLVLVPCCMALVWLRHLGPHVWLVLYLVALVAVADIGAYFIGKTWGRVKMVPKVSPGKSWAGLAGGLLCGLLFAALINVLLRLPVSTAQWLVVSLITVFASVLGDLLESMLKRHRGIKDSSNILPGHGGVLDRLDGWTAAAPLFALCLLSIGWPS